jgi:hypothetical protein
LNGVKAARENDRYHRGRRLGSHRRVIAARHDHDWPVIDQIGRKLRKLIEMALGPPVFDRNIPPLNMIDLFQALLECGHKGLIGVGRRTA